MIFSRTKNYCVLEIRIGHFLVQYISFRNAKGKDFSEEIRELQLVPARSKLDLKRMPNHERESLNMKRHLFERPFVVVPVFSQLFILPAQTRLICHSKNPSFADAIFYAQKRDGQKLSAGFFPRPPVKNALTHVTTFSHQEAQQGLTNYDL